MKVSENDYSQYLEKYKMFQTTNQIYIYIYTRTKIPMND